MCLEELCSWWLGQSIDLSTLSLGTKYKGSTTQPPFLCDDHGFLWSGNILECSASISSKQLHASCWLEHLDACTARRDPAPFQISVVGFIFPALFVRETFCCRWTSNSTFYWRQHMRVAVVKCFGYLLDTSYQAPFEKDATMLEVSPNGSNEFASVRR